MTRVEPGPKNVKPATSRRRRRPRAGAQGASAKSLARRRRPSGVRSHRAEASLVVRRGAAAAKDGVGGVVDSTLEPRYSKGTKPLADRFSPGDLVRVRSPPSARTPRGSPMPLALELGPQAAMVVMDPTTREILALVGGYDFHSGGFDRIAQRAAPAGLGVQADLLRGGHRVAEDHGRVDHQRLARGLRALEAAELREGVPRPGPRPHRAGAFDQHRRHQGAVGRRASPAARDVATRFGIALADRARPGAGAGARLADGHAARAGQRLRHVRRRRPGGQGRPLVAGERDRRSEDFAPPQLAPGLTPEVAYIMVSLMRSVIDEGTARAPPPASCAARRPARPAPPTIRSDAWFVGFTPDLLAAVWVGFDDGSSRPRRGRRQDRAAHLARLHDQGAGRPPDQGLRPAARRGHPAHRQDDRPAAPRPGQESDTLDEVFLTTPSPTEQAPAAGEEDSADKLLLDQ